MPGSLIHLPKSAVVLPVTFQAASSAYSNTNSFATSLSTSGVFDLSSYAGVPNLALVVSVNWYANGGGSAAQFITCRYNGVDLAMMVGNDRTDGATFGSQLWIMQNPPTGNFTISASQTGTANTGRNIWVGASLWSNVGGYVAGGFQVLGSGVAQTIAVGVNEVAVNAMAAGQAMNNYSQTQRQSGTVANTLRARAGDAFGDASGTKDFSSTGGTYNSAVAKLVPVAA